MGSVIRGIPVVAGRTQGEALVGDEPLSFWGGYDPHTGEIIDRRHPLSGTIAAGRILILPYTRGSSTTTAVLLEAVRSGTAPAAIVTTGPDSFLALAAIVARELYGRWFAVVSVPQEAAASLHTGDKLAIAPDGTIDIAQTG